MAICRYGATTGIGRHHLPKQTRAVTRVDEHLADLPDTTVALIIG